MDTVGIHLTSRGARGVLLTGDGTRSPGVPAEGADPVAAAQEAFAQLAPRAGRAAVAIAVDAGDLSDEQGRSAAAFLGARGDVAVVQPVTARAALVVAEAWAGGAQGASHAVCLWIGDTVLAGIMLNAQPWAGAHGFAGSAGWLALNPVERQDYRKLGCLTAEVSSIGIARRLAWRIQAGDHSSVLHRVGELGAVTAAHVFDGARAGDGVSISIVRETAKYIGMAVANLASAIDPDVTVISGPITSAGDLLAEPIRQESVRRLPPPLAARFRCDISPLGEDAVAVGAARLAARF